MLGQPVSMLIPRVVGFKLSGELPEGATATDLVLTITEMLRKHGVVGKFVEFYGAGRRRRAAGQPGHDRQHVARSTARPSRSSRSTTRRSNYLRLTGRGESRSRWSRRTPRSRASGTTPASEPRYSEYLELDLSTVVPSHRRPEAPAGPGLADRREGQLPRRRSGDYVRATGSDEQHDGYDEASAESFPASDAPSYTGSGNDAGRRATTAHAAGARRRPADRPSRGPGDARRRQRVRARPRRRGHRRDHLVHQHLQPVGDDRRRPAGQEGRRAGAHAQAVGQDHAGARAPRSSPTTTSGPASRRTWRSSASTSSATAARPASATPVR